MFKILAIESSKIYMDILERCFVVEDGYEIKIVNMIVKAKHELNKEKYDIIISEIKGDDGESEMFLREIREKNEKVYILLFTSELSIKREIRMYKYGIDGHIAKPVSVEILKAYIGRMRERIASERGTQ
jgi:DNA-binding response OmpR family regulator